MNKCALSLLLTCGTGVSSHAQLFSPEAFTGAVFGTFIGGIAGADHCHGFSGEGAAIGAGVGLLAGALVGEANRRSYAYETPGYYSYAPAPQPGYGYVYAPIYAPPPVTVTSPLSRPNYVVGATAVGALAGGLIGAANNQGWEGAGIGAASGLVVGSIAEVATRNAERKRAQAAYAISPPASQPASVVQAPPVPVPASPSPHPAPQVTSHFSRAIPPQIPDAPMVPDAPSF